MAKHVLILGAGASKQFGAPVMVEFLDVARDLWLGGKVRNDDAFERVFRAIGKLQSVHSKAEFDLVNLESVLSAFEMGRLFGSLPGLEEDEIQTLADDVKRVIVETVEKTLPQPDDVQRGFRAAPWSRLLDAVNNSGRISDRDLNSRSNVAILTFNYDLLLDCVLQANDLQIDYGFARQQRDPVTLLKLHGSLNWFVEPESDSVEAVYLSNPLIGPLTRLGEIPVVTHKVRTAFLKKHPQSKTESELVPFIVPPTWNKMDSYGAIAEVWKRAALELSEAESIYVVGYSLPPTDSYFRLLYALGSVGENPLKRFFVYNKDLDHAKKFAALLGPGARERFQPLEMGAEAAFVNIAEEIDSDF